MTKKKGKPQRHFTREKKGGPAKQKGGFKEKKKMGKKSLENLTTTRHRKCPIRGQGRL